MQPDKIDALMELKKLLDARIINDNEFAEQKKKILSDEQPTNNRQPEATNDNAQETQSTREFKHKLVWIVLGVIIVGISIVIVSQCRSKSQQYEDEYYTPEEVVVEEVIADTACVASPYGY